MAATAQAIRTARANPKETEQEREIAKAFHEIISRLDTEAKARVAQRKSTEDRWIEDLRQYHSRYPLELESRLKTQKKSRIFVNITRKRTHAWEARLSDMLFPTDDKNWGIKPTPIPELVDEKAKAQREALRMEQAANDALAADNKKAMANYLNKGAPFAARAKELQAQLDEADKRCQAMSRLIEDQFIESNYAQATRRAIHDACKLGTGVIKGPMISQRYRQKFVKVPGGPDGKTMWKMDMVPGEKVIEWQHVDLFNFFPDMSVPTIREGVSTFQRWLPNRKELRRMTKIRGFREAAVNELLTKGPQTTQPLYLGALREIHGQETSKALNDVYEVWEWHGSLEKEDLEIICTAIGDERCKEILGAAEASELDEFPMIIWFCQGQILKFGEHGLDSGESLYSAFCFERDESGPFGRGVPFMMRDSQAALNGAWRMMMDHGNVSTGPQIVYDPEQIEPEDGVRRITGNKLWRRIKNRAGIPAFEIHMITSNQAHLDRIVSLARDFADEESIIPLIAAGEQGAHTTQTKGGMAILMNASNVVFRRVVKNFDDDFTTPNVRRAYEFNMLHSELDEVKGDMQVDARGSSVLLVREMQAQNLMAMAIQFTNHPVLGPLTKAAQLYRRLVQAHNLPADEIVMTDDELKQQQQQRAENPEQSAVELQHQLNMEALAFERETKLMERKEDRITRMTELAQKHNMTLDQIEGRLQAAAMGTKSKERLFASEAAIQERRDQAARRSGQSIQKPQKKGGKGQVASSGGGYI